ncbi:autotransporter domain-containing protein [Niastella populi]|nr:autotransporter domain-containing protein [Niastella populi]
MKQRFLLSFIFVFTCMVATRAQIGKGSTWLGGSVGYSHSKDNSGAPATSTKQNNFYISPAIGTAVKENLILGVSLSYNNNTTKFGYTSAKKDRLYGGGIFLRKYWPVVNRLYIFGEAEAYYQAIRSTDNYTTGGNELKVKGWNSGIALTPGLSYAITRNLQLETGLNSLFSTRYQKRKNKQGFTNTESSAFNTGISLDNASDIFIGFRILINKKA